MRHLGSGRGWSASGYFRGENICSFSIMFSFFFPPDGLTLFTGGLACHITENRSLCSVCAPSLRLCLCFLGVFVHRSWFCLRNNKKRAFKFKFEHVSY